MRLPELWISAPLTIALLALAGSAAADPVDLKPFRASYKAEWKGITAGGATLELRPSGNDTYTYSSVNAARGVFRMAFPDALTQSSTFRVKDGHIVPLKFRGIDEKQRPIDLNFDWTRMRVTGVAKEHSVDLELPANTQDAMSMQIASLRDLAAGKLNPRAWMMDSDKLKEYELSNDGNERIETALGELDTVIYLSKRPNSDRVTRTWVAPKLGYLPVKVQRTRGKKVEFTVLIESVDD